MLRLPYRQFEVQIDSDPSFAYGSNDNSHSYHHIYRLDDELYTPTSLHTVSVIQDDGLVTVTCILIASGGGSIVHEHSAIIQSDSLLLAVGPYLTSLQLPALTLTWKVKVDWATCFGVYHSPENRCYISHGELDVAAVSYGGGLMWSNSGADIFTNGVSLTQHHVTAIDWNEDKYVWDIATGALVEVTVKKVVNPNSGVDNC